MAAQTIVVPAEESDVAAVRGEVADGAGGVILFGSSAPADLGGQLAALRGGRADVLVMTDEEGGGVQRMANLVGSLPWAAYMGRNWTAAQITARVAAVARGMSNYGVDMDLAPVVDVDGRDMPPGDTNPDGWRSFSGDTAVVDRDGVAYLRGLAQGGVIAALKHFPGVGHSTANTDNGAARTLPWSALEQVALPPFTAGIGAGASAIMVANASVPGLTEGPASLSATVISTVLRQRLHFSGLVITDSLSAGAISDAGFTVAGAAVQALRAGADMVLYTASPGATRQQFDAIVGALVAAEKAGDLPRGRLVAAATASLVARHLAVCR